MTVTVSTDDNSGGPMAGDDAVAEVEALGAALRRVKDEVGRVVFGQEAVIDEILITLLCGGHALLVGVPGLAKTRLVETFGSVIGLDNRRVQCTPDLMPADILGSEILETEGAAGRSFRFIPGPVFTQLLMADEINRASPRTQSALLQAMQEQTVTTAGETHRLPQPFHVLATQNPIEQEGTYPLPEAQLDRFLMQINVGYPDLEAERRMVLVTTGGGEAQVTQVMSGGDLARAQSLLRQVPVGENIIAAILDIVRAGRPEASDLALVRAHVAWGPGPRASQALTMAARARALLYGRLTPSLEDVLALAPPVLRHRMALSFTARAEAVTLAQVIDAMSAKYA